MAGPHYPIIVVLPIDWSGGCFGLAPTPAVGVTLLEAPRATEGWPLLPSLWLAGMAESPAIRAAVARALLRWLGFYAGSCRAVGPLPVGVATRYGDECVYAFFAAGRRLRTGAGPQLEWHPFNAIDRLLNVVLRDPHTRWLVYHLKTLLLERRIAELESGGTRGFHSGGEPAAPRSLGAASTSLASCHRLVWPCAGQEISWLDPRGAEEARGTSHPDNASVRFSTGHVFEGEPAQALCELGIPAGTTKP